MPESHIPGESEGCLDDSDVDGITDMDRSVDVTENYIRCSCFLLERYGQLKKWLVCGCGNSGIYL